MLSEYEVCKDIEAGVKRLVDGKMSKSEYNKFITESNKKLDEVKAEKRSAEFWEKYNSTCYY